MESSGASVTAFFLLLPLHFAVILTAVLHSAATLLLATLRRLLTWPRENPRGKYVLVTGAASGIGYGLVQSLIKLGCVVVACDLDEIALEKAFLSASRKQVVTLRCDVTSLREVASLRRQIEGRRIKLWAIVSNAGIFNNAKGFMATAEMPYERGREQLEVDLHGGINIVREFYPHILQNRTRIVNTLSVAGFSLQAGFYSASKAASLAYTRGVRAQLRSAGITVVAVCPGLVATPLVSPVDVSLDSLFRDEMVARLRRARRRAQPVAHVLPAFLDALFLCEPAEEYVVDYLPQAAMWALMRHLPDSQRDIFTTVLTPMLENARSYF